jgi:hypothetical protein
MTDTTYTGICQACGRRQAVHVHGGKIAKHGYTTDWGFFNGTCGGSDHLPLEQDDAYNLTVVANLHDWAAKLIDEAAGEITTVPVQVTTDQLDAYGRRKKAIVQVNADEWAARRDCYGTFEQAVERVRFGLRRQAELAVAQADELDGLRRKVHGHPLTPRAEEAPIQRETYGTYAEAYARVEELKAAGRKAQQRRDRWLRQYHVTYR